MVSLFIDANIFLEVQLQQAETSQCEKLLEYVESKRSEVWINSFLVFSMLLTIQHKTGNLEKCEQLLSILNSYQGLNVFNPSFSTILNAIRFQSNFSLDFDDALVLSCMDQLKITHIVTFDSDFDEIDKIDVLNPKEALILLQENGSKEFHKQN